MIRPIERVAVCRARISPTKRHRNGTNTSCWNGYRPKLLALEPWSRPFCVEHIGVVHTVDDGNVLGRSARRSEAAGLDAVPDICRPPGGKRAGRILDRRSVPGKARDSPRIGKGKDPARRRPRSPRATPNRKRVRTKRAFRPKCLRLNIRWLPPPPLPPTPDIPPRGFLPSSRGGGDGISLGRSPLSGGPLLMSVGSDRWRPTSKHTRRGGISRVINGTGTCSTPGATTIPCGQNRHSDKNGGKQESESPCRAC